MLDILENENEPQTHPKPQKKSFFREREYGEVPENLQNLYNTGDQEERLFLPPSPFRERAKTKPSSHRQVVKSSDDESDSEADDYLNAFNSFMEKYRDVDPETLSSEDVEGFLKYVSDKETNAYYDYSTRDQEPYPLKPKSREETKRISRGKRYWLGASNDQNERFLIQKRSAIDDKPVSSIEKNNSNAQSEVTKSSLNKTKPLKKADSKPDKYRDVKKIPKGQKELPIELKSQKPLNIKKKSVDWSNYFGVDKRQKKSDLKDERKNELLLDQYVQNYILQSVRNSAFNNHGSEYRYFPKRDKSPSYSTDEQLETDEDLRTAEELIIDNVLKYTGAHEGITDPKEIERFRQNVINELAAAYNLEKLRAELFDDDMRKKKPDDVTKHHHSS